MSSRDHRRRERSWDREDRDRDRDKVDRDKDRDRYSRSSRTGGHRDSGRRRDSRSRSPRRDRRDYDRDRNYKSSRRDYDRDRDDPRHDRKEDRRIERKSERTDEKRDNYNPERTRDKEIHPKEPSRHGEPNRPREARPVVQSAVRTESPKHDLPAPTSSKPNLDPDVDAPVEEGEEMDAIPVEDEAMMATMGLCGFGSTKGKHVEGNQEGGVNIKKMRTWRQYMNRRGGFNRPLDKIR